MQHHSKKMNPIWVVLILTIMVKGKNNATIFQNCIYHTMSYIVNYR